MKHTPTPWHAPGMGEIHDADHNLIAHIAFSAGEHDDDQVGTESDAKFIVRACNSHYQLVDALKFIANHSNDPGIVKYAEHTLAAAGEQS